MTLNSEAVSRDSAFTPRLACNSIQTATRLSSLPQHAWVHTCFPPACWLIFISWVHLNRKILNFLILPFLLEPYAPAVHSDARQGKRREATKWLGTQSYQAVGKGSRVGEIQRSNVSGFLIEKRFPNLFNSTLKCIYNPRLPELSTETVIPILSAAQLGWFIFFFNVICHQTRSYVFT